MFKNNFCIDIPNLIKMITGTDFYYTGTIPINLVEQLSQLKDIFETTEYQIFNKIPRESK